MRTYKKSILLGKDQVDKFTRQFSDEEIGASFYDDKDNICVLSYSGKHFIFSRKKEKWFEDDQHLAIPHIKYYGK